MIKNKPAGSGPAKILPNFPGRLLGGFLALFSLCWLSPAKGSTIQVSGWHIPIPTGTKQAPSWLGHDAIQGRLLCPPLAILDYAAGSTKNILAKEISATSRLSMGQMQTVWIIQLRSGLAHWDGSPLLAQDLAKFLQENLKRIITSETGQLWTLPDFLVTAEDALLVEVRWSGPPPIGPYILAHQPYFQRINQVGRLFSSLQENETTPSENVSYQCAGLYRPSADGKSLLPSLGYTATRPMLAFSQTTRGDSHIALQIANDSAKIASKETSSPVPRPCALEAPAPLATLILWNPRQTFLQNANFRRALNQMLAAATLPLSPNYHQSLLLPILEMDARPQIDTSTPSHFLLPLGLERKATNEPLRSTDGLTISLRIKLGVEIDPAVLGSIEQKFSQEGITINFAPRDSEEPIDGVMTTIMLPMGTMNYLPFLHRKAIAGELYSWRLGDENLDALLETHVKAYSQGLLNLELIRNIQAQSLASAAHHVLFRYELCVESKKAAGDAEKTMAKQGHLDWFKEFLRL